MSESALLTLLEREIGRRGLLRGTFSGAALLALGALVPAGCRSYPEPPVELKFFSREEYAVFQAIARAILGLAEDDTTDVASEVDGRIARMDRTVRRDIHWILRIFEHGTHLFDLQGRRFTRLAREAQEHYLAGWMSSSMGARRIVFRALKLMAALGYYGRGPAWSAIGYDGPWLGRRDDAPRVAFEEPRPLAELPPA